MSLFNLFKKNTSKTNVAKKIIEVIKPITSYANPNDIYTNKKYHSEKISIYHLRHNTHINCLNCSTKMVNLEQEIPTEKTRKSIKQHINKKSKKHFFNCPNCNLAYSSYCHNVTIYKDIPITFINNTLYKIIESFPKKTNTIYTNKKLLNRTSIIKKISSKIVPNLFVEIELFKCPCCKSEYNKIIHGDTWLCITCQTEFVSYGNGLKFDESKIKIVRQKLDNF